MTVKPNGTDAKDIALHFVNSTTGRATPQIMGKTINQAKSILKSGYTKTEVLDVIDYLIHTKNADLYSLGYVGASINDVLKTIRKQRAIEEAKKQLALKQVQERSVVEVESESSQRNRSKVERFGVQSGFREKYHLDLFEE